MPTLNWPERWLVSIGCGCLMAIGVEMANAEVFQQTANAALSQELTAQATPAADVQPAGAEPPAIVNGVLGRLEIPRLNLSTIVMEGDDDATLKKAVGHLPSSVFPWQTGNAVFAGHRDTFFRPLKDLRDGDVVRLVTPRGTFTYTVAGTEIVNPDDVSVLAQTPERSLTLITCYPFVYVGHAPKRFIIHAR